MTAPPPLVVATTTAFLRQHTPFNRISDETLAALVPKLKLAYFAKDAAILNPQMGAVKHLHIIHRGLVGSRPGNPNAEPDPMLSPGELFPVGALSAGGPTTRVYHAVEDTFCYLLPRDDFIALRRGSPEFERFCTQAITETLKQSLSRLQGQYSQAATDQQTLTGPLSDVIRRPPVTASADAPLVDALKLMDESAVRTLIIVGADGEPLGIFTLIDLLRRVVLAGKPLSTPVREVMSAPAVTLPATATAYEALQLIAERAIRQLIVVDGQRVAGLVSERDLFALQRVSMRTVGQTVRKARNRDGLRHAADDIRLLTRNLLAQGVAAEPLTRTIAALNDQLSRRVIELALERHELPGSGWCWMALGSEGRGEQTFATDQDNALVFAATDAADAERRRPALLAFAADINAELDALGFPLCTGNVMAGNPKMCLSVDEWKARFLDWLREPTPEALLNANIVFDFRALYGDTTLTDGLREWLFRYTQESRIFLRLMTQNALQSDPPLGLIRAFATDDDAEGRKGTIDLKTRGVRIFVDAARVYALAYGIAETGTAARLRLAAARLSIPERHVAALLEGFQFLQMLRLRQQHLAAAGGAANRIDPYALNDVDQRMLKETFRQAKLLQQELRRSFQT